ncbi:hypothetical protein D3C81_1316970 [compost metagenome]
MSSACVCHVPGEFCFYCEVYSPEVERLARERDDWRRRAEKLERDVLVETVGWDSEARLSGNLADENAKLRAGIAAAMTYPPGIIRAKLSLILAEVGADE